MSNTRPARIRALIADDEPHARHLLRSLLKDEPDIDVVGEAADGEETARMVRELAPDLLLLDIQMPALDGFAVIEDIGVERMPTVIFVTAYDQYALRAFDVHALDYLLKPFDGERLSAALKRARKHVGGHDHDDTTPRMMALLDELRRRDFPERLPIKGDGRITFVTVDEIDWVEAAGKMLRIHVGTASHLIRETMGALEQQLDPRRFVRIQRSAIVNVRRIKELQPWFQGEFVVILQDGTRLTTGRGYRQNWQGLLGPRK
jgi:two-component system LytT family response regulator